MSSESERLEQLEKLLDELNERSLIEVVIVEGIRDISALRTLGISGNIRSMQTGNSILNLCESLSKEFNRFILLTDWDRKGGQFANLFRKGLDACGAKHDSLIRAQIARLTKKDIKDVEGLPRLIKNLRNSVEGNPLSWRREMRKSE